MATRAQVSLIGSQFLLHPLSGGHPVEFTVAVSRLQFVYSKVVSHYFSNKIMFNKNSIKITMSKQYQ